MLRNFFVLAGWGCLLLGGVLGGFPNSALAAEAKLGPVQDTQINGRFITVLIDNDSDLHFCYWRNDGVYYLHQENGAWQREMLVPASSGASGRFYPQCAIDDNENVHFTWVNSPGGPVLSMKLFKSENNAGSESSYRWSAAVRIFEDTYGGGDTNRSGITVCPNGDIYTVAQSDYGIKWNFQPARGVWQYPLDQIYHHEPSEPQTPQIACGRDNIPVALFSNYWVDDDNHYVALSKINKYLPGQGASVWPSKRLTGIPGPGSLYIDNGNGIHTSWIEWLNEDEAFNAIGYSYRPESPGMVVSPRREVYVESQIVTVESPAVPVPKIAVNNRGYAVSLFSFLTENQKRVSYAVMEPTGSWPGEGSGRIRAISDEDQDQRFPGLGADPRTDNFVVAWEGGDGTEELGLIKYREIIIEE